MDFVEGGHRDAEGGLSDCEGDGGFVSETAGSYGGDVTGVEGEEGGF